jgi:hypothetical protein
MADYLVAAFWGNPALVLLPTPRRMSAEMLSMYDNALSEFRLETSTLAKSLLTHYESLGKSLNSLQFDGYFDAFSSTIQLIDAKIIPCADSLLTQSTILGNLNAFDSLVKAQGEVKDAVYRTGKRLSSNLNYAAFQLDSKDSIRIDLAKKATSWTTSERDLITFGSGWIGFFLFPIIVLVSPGDIFAKLILFIIGGPLGIVLGLAFGAVMAKVFKAEADAYIKQMSIKNQESERLKCEASTIAKVINELLQRTFSH